MAQPHPLARDARVSIGGPRAGVDLELATPPDLAPGDLLSVGGCVVLEVESAAGPVARARVVIGGDPPAGAPVARCRPGRDLTGVVLAGGLSSRFGADKLRAAWGVTDLL